MKINDIFKILRAFGVYSNNCKKCAVKPKPWLFTHAIHGVRRSLGLKAIDLGPVNDMHI